MRWLTGALAAACVLLAGCGGSTGPHLVTKPGHHNTRFLTACASADCGPNVIVLYWSNINFPGTTGYNMFANGTQVGTTVGSPYTFSGLDCNATFTLGVQAHDGQGGLSQLFTTLYTSPPCPTTPVNTSLPVASGTTVQGSVLSAGGDTWQGNPTSFAYQWSDCDSSGGNCVNATGAGNSCSNAGTGCSYTLTANDVAHTMRVTVTAANAFGSTSATSSQTAVVSAPPPSAPTNTALPVVSGTTTQGQALTTTNGSWTPSTGLTFAYQWSDCDSSGANCVNISGANASSYTLAAGDVGHTVRAVVTATNTSGSTPASSAATATIGAAASPPTNTALPAISGTATQGNVLTTTNGTWTGSPTSFVYQWQDCNTLGASCANIAGATSASYTLTASDVGDTIRAVVTASNAAGSTPASSAATGVVTSTAGSCTVTLSALTNVNADLTAGSTVCLAAGTYGAVSLTASPASNATLTAAPGAHVVVGGVSIAGNNLTVSQLYSTGSIGVGSGSPFPGFSHIVIDHNDIGPTGGYGVSVLSATGTPSSFVTISNNKIHDTCSTCEGDALRLDGWHDVTVTGNDIYNIAECAGNGCHTDTLQSFQGQVATSNLTLTRNYIHDTNGAQGFPFLKDGDISNVTISDNLAVRMISNPQVTGIWDDENIPGLVIRNNTYQSTSGSIVQSDGSASNPSLTMDHNVFDALNVKTGSSGFAYALTENHNIWTANNEFTFTPSATDTFTANPGFVNTATDDYRLASNPNGIGIDWAPAAQTYGPVTTSAPTNTALPVISGTTTQGSTLTTTNGTWTGSPTSFSYQWQDCNTSGASCVSIAAATSPTYTLIAGDVGHTIRSVVTATNTSGSTPASSAATATITSVGSPPTNSGGANLPVISGTTTQGSTLASTTGTWTGSPTSFAYQWQRCTAPTTCSNVGANSSSYTLVAADVGVTIQVAVTATNAAGSSIPATSAPTATIGAAPPATFGLSDITGAVGNGGMGVDSKRVVTATPGTSGQVTTLTVYLASTATTGTMNVRGVLYADGNVVSPATGAATAPGARLAVSDPLALTNSGAGFTAGWYTLTLPNSIAVTAGTPYWIGVLAGGTASVAQFDYVTATNALDLNANVYTSGASDPFGAIASQFSQQMAIYGTLAASGAPANTALPAVSGTATVGSVLTATHGTWSPAATSFATRWQDCTTAGVSCVNIAGATSSTYTLANGDVGDTVRAVVTATNATGAASAVSAVTATVAASATPPIWTGTFSTTKTGGFQACPNIPLAPGNFPSSSGGLNSAPGTTYTYGAWVDTHVTCVPDPLGSGATVAKYAIPDADRPPNGNGNPRADLESPWILDTGVHWISTSEYLPSNTPVPPSDGTHSGSMLWEVYGYPYAGSPPTSMAWSPRPDDLSHDYFYLGGSEGSSNFVYWQAPKNSTGSVGAWHSFIIRLDSETGTNNGSMQLWYDEVRQSFTSCAIGSCTTDGAAANDILHYTTLNSTNWDNHVHADTDQFLDINSYRPPCAEFPAEWNYCGTLTTYQGAPAFGDSFAAVASTLTTPSGP